MVANTSTLLTKDTNTVGFVNHNRAVVLMLQLNNLRQFGQVALHREYAIDNNQLDSLVRQLLQHALQISHIVVLIVQLTSKRQTATVHNTCVITIVADDIVVLTNNHCQNALIDRESCREAQAIVFTNKF